MLLCNEAGLSIWLDEAVGIIFVPEARLRLLPIVNDLSPAHLLFAVMLEECLTDMIAIGMIFVQRFSPV